MKLEITTKKIIFYEKVYHHLNFHLMKISQRLPHFKNDLPSLKLMIKKTVKKYHIKKHYHPTFTNYSNRKPDLAFFEGSLNLRLPKKPLFVSFQGKTLHECIDSGIGKLKRELEKYKDMHFNSQSEYPNHYSLRKAEVHE